MELDDLTTEEKIGIGGGGLAVIGAFLPWVAAGPFSVSGIDGDGVFTLLFGAGALALILLRDWEQTDQIGTAVLGLLTVVVGGNTFSNLGSAGGSGSISISLSPGIGLYLTVLAGLLMIAAGAMAYRNQQAEGQAMGGLGE